MQLHFNAGGTMVTKSIKMIGCVIIALFSVQAFAADPIKINVKTNEKTAQGIGYSVDGEESGGAGKSYSGTGPKNKLYKFGYRTTAQGEDIRCGTVKLTKNSNVTLVVKRGKCHSVVR